MAISSKNYVDVSTTFPSSGATNRAFGGLIFVSDAIDVDTLPDDSSASTSDINDKASAFNAGEVIDLTKDEAKLLFGAGSVVDNFADGYYSYISPSGRFPSMLKCAKYTWNADYSGVDFVDAFEKVCAQTNNFGSFTFIPPSNVISHSWTEEKTFNDLTDTEAMASADAWNVFYSQLVKVAKSNSTLDTKFLHVFNYLANTNAANLSGCESRYNDLSSVKGTTLLYGGRAASAYMPMAILASTDYTTGTVVNYMFKQFASEDPYVVVTDDSTYRRCNKSNINFYGKAQTNGQTFNFYQRGFNTDSTDTAIYCNEMWFKAQCETQIFNELIQSERLSADLVGVATVKLLVMEAGAEAVSNGTFMQKNADASETRIIREIIQSTGGEDADVSSIVADIATVGYSIYAYLTAPITGDHLGLVPEKTIAYYVFYGTADSIRFIKGTNILI